VEGAAADLQQGADSSRDQALRSRQNPNQLFADANEARRTGRADQAIVLYMQLQRAFPTSAQAQLSAVSLGRLLLERGSPGAALQQFSRYLGGPDRVLRAEALAGRARALRALGKSAEERAAWQSLLHEYPGSVYADGANKRLDELR
jgi:TolA-binding protein